MITINSNIGELRTQRELDALFNRFEFSQKDNISKVSTFCKKNEIDEEFFILLINSFSETEICSEDDFSNVNLKDIIKYLTATHNYYLYKILPEIEQTSSRLAKDLGSSSPLMMFLVSFINSYREELLSHINQEEKLFFPYVLSLQNEEQPHDYSVATFERFHEKHQFEIELARKILLSIGVPTEFQSQLRFLDNQLKQLQKDIAIHEFIEDLVLVNKAKELERLHAAH